VRKKGTAWEFLSLVAPQSHGLGDGVVALTFARRRLHLTMVGGFRWGELVLILEPRQGPVPCLALWDFRKSCEPEKCGDASSGIKKF